MTLQDTDFRACVRVCVSSCMFILFCFSERRIASKVLFYAVKHVRLNSYTIFNSNFGHFVFFSAVRCCVSSHKHNKLQNQYGSWSNIELVTCIFRIKVDRRNEVKQKKKIEKKTAKLVTGRQKNQNFKTYDFGFEMERNNGKSKATKQKMGIKTNFIYYRTETIFAYHTEMSHLMHTLVPIKPIVNHFAVNILISSRNDNRKRKSGASTFSKLSENNISVKIVLVTALPHCPIQ